MLDLLRSFRPSTYAPLPIVDEENVKHEQQHQSQQSEQQIPPLEYRQQTQCHLIALCVFLAFLNILQYARSLRSFERGFTTDFDDARESIVLEERKFSGWISYNTTTNDVYRILDDGPQYFGPPSSNMDAAWNDLLFGQYVAMTPEEASRYPGIVTSATTGKYHMQPDVYHSLHCLNALRIELEPEYYAEHPPPDADIPVPPSWARVHRDHCLDQIRQSLQCQGDLSPAPFAAWEGLHLSIAEGRTHTCRKWESIREWVVKRDELSASVPGD